MSRTCRFCHRPRIVFTRSESVPNFFKACWNSAKLSTSGSEPVLKACWNGPYATEHAPAVLERFFSVLEQTYCSASNCSNNKGSNRELSFFKFPKDPERCKRWVINCRREDCLKKDTTYLNNNCRLCATHFEASQFMNTNRNSLIKTAIPTLFTIKNAPKPISGKRKPPAIREELPLVKKGRLNDDFSINNTNETVTMNFIKEEPDSDIEPSLSTLNEQNEFDMKYEGTLQPIAFLAVKKEPKEEVPDIDIKEELNDKLLIEELDEQPCSLIDLWPQDGVISTSSTSVVNQSKQHFCPSPENGFIHTSRTSVVEPIREERHFYPCPELDLFSASTSLAEHNCDSYPEADLINTNVTSFVLPSKDEVNVAWRVNLRKIFVEKSLQNINLVKVKPYKCNVCSKKYTTKTHLKEHVRSHIARKTFKCDICGSGFSRKSYLKVHKLIHTSVKPFKCEFCLKDCISEAYLKNHICSNRGGKLYKCEVCGKKFARIQYFRAHKRVHLDLKPFTCDICGRTFATKDHIKEHILSHSGEKSFKCKVCSGEFTKRICLKTHKCKRPVKPIMYDF